MSHFYTEIYLLLINLLKLCVTISGAACKTTKIVFLFDINKLFLTKSFHSNVFSFWLNPQGAVTWKPHVWITKTFVSEKAKDSEVIIVWKKTSRKSFPWRRQFSKLAEFYSCLLGLSKNSEYREDKSWCLFVPSASLINRDLLEDAGYQTEGIKEALVHLQTP